MVSQIKSREMFYFIPMMISIFLIVGTLFAGDLPNNFDPIVGLTVTESQLIVSSDGIKALSETYPAIQLSSSTNSGQILATLDDEGGDVIYPRDTQFIVSVTAVGNATTTVVTDSSSEKTLIATTQVNNDASISSVTHFVINPRNNEQRLIQATGNKIVYQPKESK
jgi:hypothetical protein